MLLGIGSNQSLKLVTILIPPQTSGKHLYKITIGYCFLNFFYHRENGRPNGVGNKCVHSLGESSVEIDAKPRRILGGGGDRLWFVDGGPLGDQGQFRRLRSGHGSPTFGHEIPSV